MIQPLTHLAIFLAQIPPPRAWDDQEASAPAAPLPRPMQFSDLQQGLRAQLNGQTNDWYYRNLLLAITVMVVLFAILLHIRHRRKSGVAPNSLHLLRSELCRGVRFPWGSRIALWWVARSVRLPVALLLVSQELFTKSVTEWRAQNTFALLRQWAGNRLVHLQRVLFDLDPQPRS